MLETTLADAWHGRSRSACRDGLGHVGYPSWVSLRSIMGRSTDAAIGVDCPSVALRLPISDAAPRRGARDRTSLRRLRDDRWVRVELRPNGRVLRESGYFRARVGVSG